MVTVKEPQNILLSIKVTELTISCLKFCFWENEEHSSEESISGGVANAPDCPYVTARTLPPPLPNNAGMS